MDPALTAMLVDTVQHSAFAGLDGYGQPAWAVPIARKARVEYKTMRFTTAQGEERMSRALVYLPGSVAIDLRDKLTLSNGESPLLQRVDSWTDPVTGQLSYHKIYL